MLYTEASNIVHLVENKRGSVKSLILGSSYTNKRQLMALVCETLKYSSLIQKILDETGLQELEESLEETGLVKVLLYDFLFGKGLDQAGPCQDAILRHEEVLLAAVEHIKASMKISNIADFLQASTNNAVIPRYVRVNTLKAAVTDVIDQFVQEGYNLVSTAECSFSQYLNVIEHLESNDFAVDINVPELLVFPTGTEFHEHSLYLSGEIILQDKASCLPAIALNPPAGSHVIDCCAAPGNKTSLLAALMGNEGTIFAFDMDPKRVSTMDSLLERAGARCVRTLCSDFLRVNARDPKYSDVEYVLVDPSCSGSGIVNRFSTDDTSGDSERRRLDSLASFQAMILRHAMSFPSVRHVVYSTCSIHERENELVVADVLTRCRGAFQLVDVASTLDLPCRGNSDVFPGAEKCVRMTPESAMTNGFFIARFERVERGAKNDAPADQSDPWRKGRNFVVGAGGKREATAADSRAGRVPRDECSDKVVISKQKRKRRRKDGNGKIENQTAKRSTPTVATGAKEKNKKQKRSKRRGGGKAVTA